MIKEFFSKKKLKAQSTTEELVERGFAPQNGKIHILLINPPSKIRSFEDIKRYIKGGEALIKGFL